MVDDGTVHVSCLSKQLPDAVTETEVGEPEPRVKSQGNDVKSLGNVYKRKEIKQHSLHVRGMKVSTV